MPSTVRRWFGSWRSGERLSSTCSGSGHRGVAASFFVITERGPLPLVGRDSEQSSPRRTGGGVHRALQLRGTGRERAGQARVFDVRIEHAAGGFSGSLQVGEGSAASGARRVHGSSCAEVSDALAVVAAIALEGAAETSAVVAPSDSPSPDT